MPNKNHESSREQARVLASLEKARKRLRYEDDEEVLSWVKLTQSEIDEIWTQLERKR